MLLQHFQHFEVVAFDDDIACGVPVQGVVSIWSKRGRGGCLGGTDGLCLTRPKQTETLGAGCGVIAEYSLERGDIDLAVSNDLGQEVCELACNVGVKVRCCGRNLLDVFFVHSSVLRCLLGLG